MITRKGSCLCGSRSYEIDGDLDGVWMCDITTNTPVDAEHRVAERDPQIRSFRQDRNSNML
jgi:hypothetical protein